MDSDSVTSHSAGIQQLQTVIFELIRAEREYVKDLETLEVVYIRPLYAADPPAGIIPQDRLDRFGTDVFDKVSKFSGYHKPLLEQLELEEHPSVRSVVTAVSKAAVDFREAYLDYISHYPIAAYLVDNEMAVNPKFKAFMEEGVRRPETHLQDMKTYLNKPTSYLSRLSVLLKEISDGTPPGHEDHGTISEVLHEIHGLIQATKPGVESAEKKVEMWSYSANMIFEQGFIDMDLLNENRTLIHTGRFLHDLDSCFECSSWSEVLVLLYDNYLIIMEPKEKDGVTTYHVSRRPIPLDLLALVSFSDPPIQRRTGRRRSRPEGEEPTSPDATAAYSGKIYPCTLHHTGLGRFWNLYAESEEVRTEWSRKLREAIGSRKAIQDSNKIFKVNTLNVNALFVPPKTSADILDPSFNSAGSINCSLSFTSTDGRHVVAFGCENGVWMGFRDDPTSLRRVLHLKMISQLALLEDFGIFLVLADKDLFAYAIEALQPSSSLTSQTSPTSQKLNGKKHVEFFTVGIMAERTLVIYMKKKGLDSVFRVLEPVINMNEKPVSVGSRLVPRPQESEWFRIYRDFFLPSDAFDVIFLKAKLAIFVTKGFEIMHLTDFKSVTIPQVDDHSIGKQRKRWQSGRPLGMSRVNDDEFMLCYNEFGIYVDKHGDPSRQSRTVEWEGSAKHVALHYPYVLLFCNHFVEIRHVETGFLVQIIHGHDMRCLWDGRGRSTLKEVTEPCIHGVMNAVEPDVRPDSQSLRQHVFELLPVNRPQSKIFPPT